MGQALDSDGHILGEAVGQTKREVFEKLAAQHPDAAEIRVKTLMQKFHQQEQNDAPTQSMMPGPMCESDRREPRITFSRRKELMTFASGLAELVMEKTKSHERCLLRSMVENLLEDRR